MTSPLTGDRSRYEPGTLGAATLRSRRQPSKSLALGRLQRSIGRQLALVCVVTLAVAGAGIAYDISGGVSGLSSALFWLPLALAFALAIALVRELSRNTVTSLSSFGKHRDYSILGAAPELTPRMLRQLPPDKRTPLGCLAFQPSSLFATAFRDLQSALSEARSVSFISAMPDDGASTVALCTAVSVAQQGRSVIIVDCDVRRRSLTRVMDWDPEDGVLEASTAPDAWRHLVLEEGETGVHVLPAARPNSPWKSLVGSPGFPVLLRRLSEAYDLVVLDCPPALSSAEGSALAGKAEKCVIVTAWDSTPLAAVRKTVRAMQGQPQTVSGVYVNRVPPQYRFGRLRPD